MYKFILSVIFSVILGMSFSQKSAIIDELVDAENYLSLVVKRTSFALDYIRKADNENRFEEKKNYCKKAKGEAEYCKKQSSYAADEVYNILSKVRELSCQETLILSEKIDLMLQDAKSMFDDSYDQLRKAEYADNDEDLEDFMKKGKKYFQESLEKIKNVQSILVETKDSVNNCY